MAEDFVQRPIRTTGGDVITPLYHKILLILKERIEQGYYAETGVLPSEHDLCEEFGVSRITVSRSVREMAELGLVVRKRGAATRIVSPTISPTIPGDIDDFIENVVDLGKRSTVRVLEFGFVSANHDVQSALKVKQGAEVQRAVRVRSYRGSPFSYLTSYLPEDIGRALSRDDMEVSSLLGLLEDMNINIGSAEQSVSAALADPQTGPALEVPVGTPLLAIERVVRDTDDRPVEYIRILYRTDKYKYRMRMDKKEV
eukprot:TRINITY_DN39845_c0_g1_i1.p1 TRINITY_DN39845_c0_g1~~TRINITY_DN39845_c0_g1_i1.p1  ORF type:complete len:256 (+),score=-2.84 TRINITY_DN39845_c0_g1_i1:254-1021(+)